MLIWYVVIGSLLLIAALLWCLKVLSVTYLDLYEQGLVALKKQDYKKARDLFAKSLKKNPVFTEAKYNLALALLSLEDYEKAQTNFLEVLEETPDDFSALFNLALAYQLDEKDEEALEYYQKAIFINASDVDCYLNIAIIFFDKKDYEKSLEYLTMAKDIAPDKTEVLFLITRCKDETCSYEKDEEAEDILAEYDALKERSVLPEEFWITFARAYAKAGKMMQPIEICAQIIEQDYFNDDAYRLLALLQLLKDDPENAKANLNKAIDIDPDIPESYNLLAYAFLKEDNKEDFEKMKIKYKNILNASQAK